MALKMLFMNLTALGGVSSSAHGDVRVLTTQNVTHVTPAWKVTEVAADVTYRESSCAYYYVLAYAFA
jgi:hypothetical protein